MIVDFKGEVLEKNVGRKNLDESLAIPQNCLSFHHQTFMLYSINLVMMMLKTVDLCVVANTL